MEQSVKDIVIKTVIVVKLFSVAKYTHVVEMNQKTNKSQRNGSQNSDIECSEIV